MTTEDRPDILLTHGFHLEEDAREQEVMRPYPPLGLLYLSAHLKAAGLRVEIHDSTFARPDDLRRVLDARRPPVVGIYGNLGTRRSVVRAARMAADHGARVVLGGPEPPSYPHEYLDRGADVIVQGEGERTLEELVPRLIAAGPGPGPVGDLSDVHGIIFRQGRDQGQGRAAELVRTPAREAIKDLDSLVWPDREAIDIDRYLEVWRTHHGFGPVSIITARGCPYECQWCSHGVFGYSHRRRTPAGTADEAQAIAERYRPDGLWYADDVFTINYRWLRTYASELESRGLHLPFETITREDRLNEEMVDILAAMGCRRLWIGAESGSQRILDAMKRRTDAERMREMIHLVQSRGIEAGTFIMVGYEGETFSDMRATMEHVRASQPDQLLTTVAYPIKGTPYYHQVADRLVAPDDWENTTDRDVVIAGRHSPRYYRHAIRWITAEVARERARRNGGSPIVRARALASSCLGRAGMWLARNEREGGDVPPSAGAPDRGTPDRGELEAEAV